MFRGFFFQPPHCLPCLVLLFFPFDPFSTMPVLSVLKYSASSSSSFTSCLYLIHRKTENALLASFPIQHFDRVEEGDERMKLKNEMETRMFSWICVRFVVCFLGEVRGESDLKWQSSYHPLLAPCKLENWRLFLTPPSIAALFYCQYLARKENLIYFLFYVSYPLQYLPCSCFCLLGIEWLFCNGAFWMHYV